MPMSPFCRMNHESSVLCLDRTSTVLREAGIGTETNSAPENFRRMVKGSDRAMMIVLLVVVAIVALSGLFSTIFIK